MFTLLIASVFLVNEEYDAGYEGNAKTKMYFNFNFAEFIVRKTFVREYRVTSFLVLRMICYEIKVKIRFEPIGFRSSG